MPNFKFLRQTFQKKTAVTDGHVSDLIRVPLFLLRYGTLKIPKNGKSRFTKIFSVGLLFLDGTGQYSGYSQT